MPKYYKGYRIGSIERALLKGLLGVKSIEISKFDKNETILKIIKTYRQKVELPENIKRLINKKLAKLERNKQGELVITLTPIGKILTENIINKTLKTSPKEWDKKWRVVMFDIPEKRRKYRDLLRITLKRFGFVQIQNSVWIYPHPCKEIVTLIKTYFELNSEVIYMTVISVEGEEKIKKIFKLK